MGELQKKQNNGILSRFHLTFFQQKNKYFNTKAFYGAKLTKNVDYY